MDIFWAHVAQHRYQTYTAPDGSTQTRIFDPARVVLSANRRFPLFHAKDGNPDPDLVNGYQIVPFGMGAIDYERFLSRVGNTSTRNPMVEQDNAPGGPRARASRCCTRSSATRTWPRCVADCRANAGPRPADQPLQRPSRPGTGSRPSPKT